MPLSEAPKARRRGTIEGVLNPAYFGENSLDVRHNLHHLSNSTNMLSNSTNTLSATAQARRASFMKSTTMSRQSSQSSVMGGGRSRAPTLATISPHQLANMRIIPTADASIDEIETTVNGQQQQKEEMEGDEMNDDAFHVSALSDAYESLDYELIENDLHKKQEHNTVVHQRILFRQTLNRWLVCFMIGVITALIACAIDIMVTYTSKLKYEIIVGTLFNYCGPNDCLYGTLLAWIGLNCIFVTIACSLVVFFAGPVASGSGIPQIKCFLNGIMIPGVTNLKTLVAKAGGVACSVAGGLSVGKEGPMIHSGAVVAAGISQGRGTTLPFDLHIFEYFRNDREKRDFVSAGAAAGVAAAFGAPIGGVLFSLEEGASFWNQSLTWRMFFASMVSQFTLSLILSWYHDQPGQLSWGGLANFGEFKNVNYNWWELPIYILMGVFGGLSGALFNSLNTRLTIFRQHFIQKPWQKLLEALLVSSVSCVMAFAMIFWLDDCEPLRVSNDANETLPLQMFCKNGEYSTVGQLFLRSPEETAKVIFHDPIDTYAPVTMLLFALLYYLLTMWTYGVSVPSGLFIPCLVTGAAWGRLVGLFINWIEPNPIIPLSIGKFALAGAAAQLGGVVRMTISLCTIIMEATREITFGLPLILVLLFAKWTGDLFNEGLYDIHIHLNEVPLIGWDAPKVAANILAEQVMGPWKIIYFKCVENVGTIMHFLKNTRHNGFPVANDFNELQGLILRHQLVTLLHLRAFKVSGDPNAPMVDGAKSPELSDFQYSDLTADQLTNITDRELNECYMDLRPYMNPSPQRATQHASLSGMFKVFRGLGLRHIVVVDDSNRILGIVTRKDIARFREVKKGRKFYVNEIPISQH